MPDTTIAKRFWSKVERDQGGCWVWTGWKRQSPTRNKLKPLFYGVFGSRPNRMLAHRLAYELATGPIPDGLVIRHTCDNGLCVNPAHLIPGTHAQNMADASERGRLPHGEAHWKAAVDAERVREIRRLIASGMSQANVRRKLNLGRSCVGHIVRGKTWGHLDRKEP